MIFSEKDFQGILGMTREKFIEKERDNPGEIFLKKDVPVWRKTGEQDKNFLFIENYYSSDSYSARLLKEEDFLKDGVEKRNEPLINFLESINAKSKPLNFLCYGGQYKTAILLKNLGYEVDLVDFPHKVFQLYQSKFSGSISFFSPKGHGEGLFPDKLYKVVIASSALERYFNPWALAKAFSNHIEKDGIFFAPMEQAQHFECIGSMDLPSFSTILKSCGFAVPLDLPGFAFKYTSMEYGVKRFRDMEKGIVAVIQREMFSETINSIFRPKKILIIGGGRAEFCKRGYTLNIAGSADIRARGELLPIKEGSLDLIWSSHSLEHMKDTRKTLREWIRALRIGGLLAIVVPVLPYHHHNKEIYEKPGLTCYEEHTIEEFKEIFQEIGGTKLLHFDKRQNKIDLDIILRKEK